MKQISQTSDWDTPGVAELIDQVWRQDASHYEYYHRLILSRLVAHYLKDLPGKVLDIGCGTGYFYELLVPSVLDNSNYLGIDSSREMLKLAQNRNPSGNFQPGNLFELSFSNDSVETVICFEVFGHLPEMVRPIAEAFRVCSGQFLFSVWISDQQESLFKNEYVGDTKFLHNFYTHADVVRLIEQAVDMSILSDLEVRVLSSNLWVYCLRKGMNKGFGMKDARIMTFPGILEELARHNIMQQEAYRCELKSLQSRCQELTALCEQLQVQSGDQNI